MSLGHNKLKIFVFLMVFTPCFLAFPKNITANSKLSDDEAIVLLRSALYKPLGENLINTFFSSDPKDINNQAALMIMKNAIQYKSINYAFIEIPKKALIDFLKKGAFFLSLYGVGFEEIMIKLEKESIKEAKKLIEKWLDENQIKIVSGYINKYDFVSYKGNKQNPVFGYNILKKPKENGSGDRKISEVFIEFYSSEFIEPPLSRGSSLLWGNFWNEDEWENLGQERVPPFIIRIKGDVIEEYNTYSWPESTSLEVIFDEPVPEVKIPTLLEIVKEKIKEKIEDYLSNPFFNINIFKAQIIDTIITQADKNGNFNVSDINSQLDDLLRNLENQCFDNACYQNNKQLAENHIDIQEILDDISEKIDVLAQEIARLTGKEIADIKEEDYKQNDDEEQEKTYGSMESEPIWCAKTENSQPLTNKIIINEVAWMGSNSSASDEWIEIKNVSEQSINLNGWQILDKGRQIKIYFDQKYEISSGGLLLLERTDENSVPFVISDYIYSGALSNSNESLELFDSNCVLQDEVLADPNWPAGDPEERRSMERAEDLSWHNYFGFGSNGIMGTPKGKNSELDQLDFSNKILITEIQTAGATGDKEEFVELYNPNDKEIDLTNWYIQKKTKSGSISYFDKKSLFLGKKINAKGYFLIAREGYFADLVDISVDAALSGDTALILKDPSNKVSDKVGWGEASDYETEPTENPEKGKALARKLADEYVDTDNNKDDFEQQDSSPKADNRKTNNSFWPMFQHDNRHTGRSGFEASSSMGFKWAYEMVAMDSNCFSTTNQSVIDSQGVIYFGVGQNNCGETNDWGTIFAVNPSGTLKWKFEGLSFPAFHISIGLDKTIYVSSANSLYALDNNGVEKWEFIADSNISAPNLSNDGFIYFTSYSNIYCLDSNGIKQWISSGVFRGGSVPSGPAIGQDGTIYGVWTGFQNMSDEQRGYVFAYQKENGLAKWQKPLQFSASSPLVGENGDVYVMAGTPGYFGNNRQLYAFGADGASKWNSASQYGDIYTPVILENGNIAIFDNWTAVAGESWGHYVWQPFSQITIFDPNGNILWTSGPVESSSINKQPIIDGKGIFIIPKILYERYSPSIWSGWWYRQVKNILVGINADSGIEEWQIDLPDNLLSFFALSEDGSIYFSAKEDILEGGVRISLYSFGSSGVLFKTVEEIEVTGDQELNEEINLLLSAFDEDLGLEFDEEVGMEDELEILDFQPEIKIGNTEVNIENNVEYNIDDENNTENNIGQSETIGNDVEMSDQQITEEQLIPESEQLPDNNSLENINIPPEPEIIQQPENTDI